MLSDRIKQAMLTHCTNKIDHIWYMHQIILSFTHSILGRVWCLLFGQVKMQIYASHQGKLPFTAPFPTRWPMEIHAHMSLEIFQSEHTSEWRRFQEHVHRVWFLAHRKIYISVQKWYNFDFFVDGTQCSSAIYYCCPATLAWLHAQFCFQRGNGSFNTCTHGSECFPNTYTSKWHSLNERWVPACRRTQPRMFRWWTRLNESIAAVPQRDCTRRRLSNKAA